MATETKRRSMTVYRVSENKAGSEQIYLGQNETIGKENQGVQVVQIGNKEQQATITTDSKLNELATSLKQSFSTDGKSASVYHVSTSQTEQVEPGTNTEGPRDIYLVQTNINKNPYENFENEKLELVVDPNVDLTTEDNPIIVYRMSDAQPDLNQTDPSQPDYIKNKEAVKDVRPVQVNGQEFLDGKPDSGSVNFVAGDNVHLEAKDNTIIISASGGGASGGGADVVEGSGIDIVLNAFGQKVVSLEPNSITDKYINNVSVSKLVSDDKMVLILNGGKANVGT